MWERTFHVGVDARVLAERHTGVAVYTRLLLKHMLLARPASRLTLFSHRRIDPTVVESIGTPDQVSVRPLWCPSPMLIRPLWDHVLLPFAARRNLDLFFSPLSVVPWFLDIPKVVTVHDLGFLRFPQIQPVKYRWYWQAALGRSVRVADRIIGVSESTSQDIVELLDGDPKRVNVVHEAVNPFFFEEPESDEESRLLHALGLQSLFILTVGTVEPRKNYSTVLKAFNRIQQQRQDVQLLIVGSPGWLSEDIAYMIRRRRNVLWLDDADDGTLRVLYRNAAVFLFPSLYEGFGLPVLEAMACGTPVVTSEAGSLPEIGGDAARYVSPNNTEGIAEAVLRFLDDSALREDYVGKGRENVRRFSWETAAEKTWRVFHEAIAGRL